MTEKTPKPTQPCDVTVTVSGDRGSGKSYLIAVLAQALRGAGHTATTEEHIPSALRAISDLTQPYNVTFREADPAVREEATQVLHEAADEITSLRDKLSTALAEIDALQGRKQKLSATLDEFRAVNIAQAKENADLEKQVIHWKTQMGALSDCNVAFREENANLKAAAKVQPVGLPAAEIERLITTAMTHVRDATIIEQSRQELHRQADSLKSDASKLRNESEARSREAHALLTRALTGQRPAPATLATIQAERRASAQRLSAEDKLALANGADPDVLVGGTTKSAAAHPVADVVAGEATLASMLAREIDASGLI